MMIKSKMKNFNITHKICNIKINTDNNTDNNNNNNNNNIIIIIIIINKK